MYSYRHIYTPVLAPLRLSVYFDLTTCPNHHHILKGLSIPIPGLYLQDGSNDLTASMFILSYLYLSLTPPVQLSNLASCASKCCLHYLMPLQVLCEHSGPTTREQLDPPIRSSLSSSPSVISSSRWATFKQLSRWALFTRPTIHWLQSITPTQFCSLWRKPESLPWTSTAYLATSAAI